MSSVFRMIDVGCKPITKRKAVAKGEILLSEKVCVAILEKKVPKGDVLALAEVSGIVGAKKTSEILPLCHPLPLDAVRIDCDVEAHRNVVVVTCEVVTHGKTGVEMEALCGVQAALLCIYDLTKALDKGAVIGAVQLMHKEGGKSGLWSRDPETLAQGSFEGVRAGLFTISDRCARGAAEDISGKIILSFLEEEGAAVVFTEILPDESELIRNAIMSASRQAAVLIVTGGTGIGPRDVTPEALSPLWTKTLPGFGEYFRAKGMCSTARAWLSRVEAGLIGSCLVFVLPGSPAAVKDGLAVIKDHIAHMLAIVNGEGHT